VQVLRLCYLTFFVGSILQSCWPKYFMLYDGNFGVRCCSSHFYTLSEAGVFILHGFQMIEDKIYRST